MFDTFITINRQSLLLIGWPDAVVADDDRAVLSRLFGSLSSFGRAEAWVEAELVDGNPN